VRARHRQSLVDERDLDILQQNGQWPWPPALNQPRHAQEDGLGHWACRAKAVKCHNFCDLTPANWHLVAIMSAHGIAYVIEDQLQSCCKTLLKMGYWRSRRCYRNNHRMHICWYLFRIMARAETDCLQHALEMLFMLKADLQYRSNRFTNFRR